MIGDRFSEGRTAARWSRAVRLASHPLTPLLAAALASLTVGLFLHPNGYLLLAGISALVAVGIAWPMVTVLGVSARLSFPVSRANEGEAIRCVLTVRNRLPWPVYGLSLEGGMTRRGCSDAEATGSATALAFVAELGPRSSQTIEWDWTPPVRGEYPGQPLRLNCRFPFGLVSLGRSVPSVGSVLVRPQVHRVARVVDAVGLRGRESTDFLDRPGQSGELIGVRPYRIGDPLRRVHWGQTARHDRLILCEMQASVRTPDAQVVLDLAPGVAGSDDPDGWREWAVRAAASLLSEYLDAGLVVSAVWGSTVVPSAGGSRHREQLLDRLARLPTSRELVDWPVLPTLLSQPAVRSFTHGLQIVITAEPAAVASASTDKPTDRRWVLIRPSGFEPASDAARPNGPRPWLLLDSPARAAEQLQHPSEGRTSCLPRSPVSSPQGKAPSARRRSPTSSSPTSSSPTPASSAVASFAVTTSRPSTSLPAPPCEC